MNKMSRWWYVVILICILWIAVIMRGWGIFNHPSDDEFSALFKGETVKSNPLKWVDAVLGLANSPILSRDRAESLPVNIERFSVTDKEAIVADKEAQGKLLFVGIRCAVVQGKWKEVSRFVDYGLKAGLDSTTVYWPAIALYNAELLSRRDSTESAILAFEGLMPSELMVVAPDTAIKQTVGEVAKRRYRQLTFGQKMIWVVDSWSRRKGRDVTIANYLQKKLGIATQARGGWAKHFLRCLSRTDK